VVAVVIKKQLLPIFLLVVGVALEQLAELIVEIFQVQAGQEQFLQYLGQALLMLVVVAVVVLVTVRTTLLLVVAELVVAEMAGKEPLDHLELQIAVVAVVVADEAQLVLAQKIITAVQAALEL
jgi:hypothetical protein